jgi:hypothetical protein
MTHSAPPELSWVTVLLRNSPKCRALVTDSRRAAGQSETLGLCGLPRSAP